MQAEYSKNKETSFIQHFNILKNNLINQKSSKNLLF